MGAASLGSVFPPAGYRGVHAWRRGLARPSGFDVVYGIALREPTQLTPIGRDFKLMDNKAGRVRLMATFEDWKFRFPHASELDRRLLTAELGKEPIGVEKPTRGAGQQAELGAIVIVVGYLVLRDVVRYFLREPRQQQVIEVILPDGTVIRLPIGSGISAVERDDRIPDEVWDYLEGG